MAFVVVYDASVLYPSTLRDLLIRLAQRGLAQAKWTERILDEMLAAVMRNRPDLDSAKLNRTRELMIASIRDCMVNEYEPLIDSLKLPDPDDRHVLAAAMKARAHVIVTDNLRDFPAEDLSAWDIEPKSADEFIADQVGLDKDLVWRCVEDIAGSWRNPPASAADVLASLERCGLTQSVAALRSARTGG